MLTSAAGADDAPDAHRRHRHLPGCLAERAGDRVHLGPRRAAPDLRDGRGGAERAPAVARGKLQRLRRLVAARGPARLLAPGSTAGSRSSSLDLDRRTVAAAHAGNGNNEDPRWSPDGRHLVFSSNRVGGSYEIYSMAVGRERRAAPDARRRFLHAGLVALILLPCDCHYSIIAGHAVFALDSFGGSAT